MFLSSELQWQLGSSLGLVQVKIIWIGALLANNNLHRAYALLSSNLACLIGSQMLSLNRFNISKLQWVTVIKLGPCPCFRVWALRDEDKCPSLLLSLHLILSVFLSSRALKELSLWSWSFSAGFFRLGIQVHALQRNADTNLLITSIKISWPYKLTHQVLIEYDLRQAELIRLSNAQQNCREAFFLK